MVFYYLHSGKILSAERPVTGLLLGEFITVNPSKASSNNNYEAIKPWNPMSTLNLWPVPLKKRRGVLDFKNCLVSKVYGSTEAPEEEGTVCQASQVTRGAAGGEAVCAFSWVCSWHSVECQRPRYHQLVRDAFFPTHLPASDIKCPFYHLIRPVPRERLISIIYT